VSRRRRRAPPEQSGRVDFVGLICSTVRSQVLVYHFMFGPSYADGCPVNSSIADALRQSDPAPEGSGRVVHRGLRSADREVRGVPRADGVGLHLGMQLSERFPAAVSETAIGVTVTTRTIEIV
jgi:hypothetical protein